jgi:hypothetical protein
VLYYNIPEPSHATKVPLLTVWLAALPRYGIITINQKNGECASMATSKLETISLEEFDRRLDAGNERLRQESAEAQERVQRLEALIARKEIFSQRLTQILTEIEREENEIATLEKGLYSPRAAACRRPPALKAPL